MVSRAGIAAVILAATVLFVVGIVIENGEADEHGDETVAHASGEGLAEEAGESAEGEAGEASESTATTTEADEEEDEDEERVLGIDLESTPFVILAVVVSLGLATAVWIAPARELFFALVAVALAMIAFAALDIAEVFHQIDESKGGIAALAGLVALLHLGAGFLAARLGRRPA
jgi:hypothetical protein